MGFRGICKLLGSGKAKAMPGLGFTWFASARCIGFRI